MNSNELIRNIVKNEYCSGCGACAAVKESDFQMRFTPDGRYEAEPKLEQGFRSSRDYSQVCPFASTYDETAIAFDLFAEEENIEHNQYEGYAIQRFAGHANSSFRTQGSSGGLTTWLLDKLLEENIVQSVVHVRPNASPGGQLYTYSISYDEDGLSSGASSKYYPSRWLMYFKECERRESPVQ